MMRLRLKSILYKILLMILLVGLTQAVILITMSFNISQTTLLNQIAESGLNSSRAYADLIGSWFKNSINEMNAYANCPEIKTMEWDRMSPYLTNEFYSKIDIYDHLFVANAKGNYSTTLVKNAGNISDRPYFAPVMNGQVIVSDPVISRTTGNQISVVAVPIKDTQGKVVGLMGGALNLSKLSVLIQNSSVDFENAYSYIIDSKGMIITYHDRKYIMHENISIPSDLVSESLVNASKEILTEDHGYVEYIHDGVKSLSYYTKIPNTKNWKLVTKVPHAYVYRPLYHTNKNLIIVSLLSLVVSVILAGFVARGISNPIIKLNKVFQRATNGDLNARAEYQTMDEIGQAARSFNQMMETISNLTFYDSLTGLPNKQQFMEKLNSEITVSGKNSERLAVIIFDIDKFENINNALGHSGGDRLLKLVAFEIKKAINASDVACRLGEDRFAILLRNNPQETFAVSTSLKLLELTKQPWIIDDQTLHVTACVGIAFFPNDGANAEVLLKNALSAMLRSKKTGRSSYQLYDSNMSAQLLDRIELSNHLHDALSNNEFMLHYQPQVDIDTGRIVGAEALIRWNNPKLGLVSPAKFIPLAEENELIVPIGDWVLRTACSQNKKWMDMGFDPIYISVNISALQIHQKDFIDKIKQVLEDTQMDPKYLELEITESIAMEDTETRIQILKTLQSMGLRVAIDDFGTGYSSLSYLRRFHITTLKIDQSFIRELTTNEKDASIVSTILAIGQNLNLVVTAEGVETQEQLAFLKQKKCHTMQGYLYSKPLPANAFEELLKNPPVLKNISR